MYFVRSGTIEYLKGCPGAGHDISTLARKTMPQEEGSTSLGAEDWFCEAALWTTWCHRGICLVTHGCVVVEVESGKFADLTANHQVAIVQVRMYSREWFKRAVLTDDLAFRNFDVLQDIAQ